MEIGKWTMVVIKFRVLQVLRHPISKNSVQKYSAKDIIQSILKAARDLKHINSKKIFPCDFYLKFSSLSTL